MIAKTLKTRRPSNLAGQGLGTQIVTIELFPFSDKQRNCFNQRPSPNITVPVGRICLPSIDRL